MFHSRLSAILTIAGVLAVGSAAVTNCYGRGSVGGPPPTTTTTTAPIARSFGFFPTFGGPGTPVMAHGTGCVGAHPEAIIALTANADPTTVLAQGAGFPDASGNWQTDLQTPWNVTNGGAYSITATCYAPYPTAVVFVYGSEPFTGAPPDCPPAC